MSNFIEVVVVVVVVVVAAAVVGVLVVVVVDPDCHKKIYYILQFLSDL
jgi:hypothetical protein